jgi:hypothetical protein
MLKDIKQRFWLDFANIFPRKRAGGENSSIPLEE